MADLRDLASRTLTGQRTQLAARAAVAAAIAWQLGLLVPGPADSYPYYAPLGAVLACNQTLAGSVRESAQMLFAIVLGAGTALLATMLVEPSGLSIAALVIVCVALGGLPALGSSRSWVPVAGLFVLIIGSGDADSYVMGYTAQMALGVVVGLAVNAVAPSLLVGWSSRTLDDVSRSLAGQLRLVSEALREEGTADEGDEGAEGGRRVELARLALQVREDMEWVRESLVGNFRARAHRSSVLQERSRAGRLNELVLMTQALVSLLQAVGDEEVGGGLDSTGRDLVAQVLDALADAIDDSAGAVPTRAATNRLRAAVKAMEDRARDLRDRGDNDMEAAAVTALLRHTERVVTAPTREAESVPGD
ncbi:FUSC family protein [Jiangella gansuensis]|uniref:FUSC family protein n=1 Tax=Jiangella gansuensis TaxID=281473 RepID=UPI0004B39316|nr:FUSC family protein [Jiangella gansuensis]